MAEGEGWEGLLGRLFSILGVHELVGVWRVAPLGAGRGMFRLSHTVLLLPPLLLWRCCVGVVGRSVLCIRLTWPPRDLGGF